VSAKRLVNRFVEGQRSRRSPVDCALYVLNCGIEAVGYWPSPRARTRRAGQPVERVPALAVG